MDCHLDVAPESVTRVHDNISNISRRGQQRVQHPACGKGRHLENDTYTEIHVSLKKVSKSKRFDLHSFLQKCSTWPYTFLPMPPKRGLPPKKTKKQKIILFLHVLAGSTELRVLRGSRPRQLRRAEESDPADPPGRAPSGRSLLRSVDPCA